MSVLTASLTTEAPPSRGIVSRMSVYRLATFSFSHFVQNADPLSAGPRSDPASSMLWQRLHAASKRGLPRAACADVYTPSHTFLSPGASCCADASAHAHIHNATASPSAGTRFVITCSALSRSSRVARESVVTRATRWETCWPEARRPQHLHKRPCRGFL